MLDASFDRGRDTLALRAGAFTAQRSGSNLMLMGADYQVVAPVGAHGLMIEFADDARLLTFDPALSTALLGTQAIDVIPVALAAIA